VLPRPSLDLRGPTSKGRGWKGRGIEWRVGERRGEGEDDLFSVTF